MTKELKEALHKVMGACIDFKAHGVDMFLAYSPHCDVNSPFGSYAIYYHTNGAWRDGGIQYVDYLTDIGVDELTNTLENLKKIAIKFAFTLEVDE